MWFEIDNGYKAIAELQDRWRNRSRRLRATLIGMDFATLGAQR